MKNPRIAHRADFAHFDESCRQAERLVHGRMFFLPRSVLITMSLILTGVVTIGVVWFIQTALLRNDRFEDARITEHSQMAEKVFGKK